jgi:hypothetical protein
MLPVACPNTKSVFEGAFSTPFSPPLVLEARSGTKFQLLPLFNIVGPFLGLTRNLGVRQLLSSIDLYIHGQVHFTVVASQNIISGGGMRLGDILVASNGKTIEVWAESHIFLCENCEIAILV